MDLCLYSYEIASSRWCVEHSITKTGRNVPMTYFPFKYDLLDHSYMRNYVSLAWNSGCRIELCYQFLFLNGIGGFVPSIKKILCIMPCQCHLKGKRIYTGSNMIFVTMKHGVMAVRYRDGNG
jgi:hypothetical protein